MLKTYNENKNIFSAVVKTKSYCFNFIQIEEIKFKKYFNRSLARRKVHLKIRRGDKKSIHKIENKTREIQRRKF